MSKRGKRRWWTCRRIILTALLGILGLFVLMLIAVMGDTRQSSSDRRITQQAQTVVAADRVQPSATITDTSTYTPTQMEPLAATQAALETSQAILVQRQAEINAAQTQRAMPTATATETAPPSNTPVPSATLTETPIPSPIPPTDAPAQTFYTTSSANARACPQLDCAIVTTLQSGLAIKAVGTATGDTYQGSTLWRIVQIGGQRAYVHSKLVSQNPPRPTRPPVQAQPVRPQPQPPQQSQPPAQQWNCSGNLYNCSDFSTCNQVMSYFNTCPGDPSRLDGDHDGRPCESLCGG